MSRIKKICHYITARAAYWFYGRPSRKLIVVGVTGTKGKSTSCRLIASVLEAAGHKVGLLTTVEFQIAGRRWLNDKKMTMLGRGQIQCMLKDMVKAGCRYAVVETSSQGILQFRHIGIDYDVVVFTNLAPEHVEAHGGFENLKKDKGKIFAELMLRHKKVFDGKNVPKVIVANADDPNAAYYLGFPADKKITFGIRNPADVRGEVLGTGVFGSKFRAGGQEYELKIAGQFNIYNALAAVAVGQSQNVPEEKIKYGLKNVPVVEGRMEFIEAGQNFKVIVDYAHEPLSLTGLFNAMRKIAGPGGKSIAVIGSDGGGRDKGKREKMGEVAATLCDYVIITDVNCFDEDPRQIAEMLAVGARKAGKKDGADLFIEIDRRKGIEKAFSLAGPGDAVAITAKGTEPCIVVGGNKKIPWDDRRVAREILSSKSYEPR